MEAETKHALQIMRASNLPMLDLNDSYPGLVGGDGLLTDYGRWVADGLIAGDDACTVDARARALVNGGFYQVSRRHCIVARLPFGKGGCDALYDAAMDHLGDDGIALTEATRAFWKVEHRKWADGMSEIGACDQFLRVYARYYEGLEIRVPQDVFDAYRALGGRTSR